MDNDVVKMKLFQFSLRDSAKNWFSSLPRNSIDSWNKCKDAFITKELDENDAKELPNSWVKSLDDHTIFLCGIEFCFS